MLIKIPVKKGKPKTYTMECKPTEKGSNPLLAASYPDTKWLSTRPFDTAEFMLHVSGRPFMPGEVDFDSPHSRSQSPPSTGLVSKFRTTAVPEC